MVLFENPYKDLYIQFLEKNDIRYNVSEMDDNTVFVYFAGDYKEVIQVMISFGGEGENKRHITAYCFDVATATTDSYLNCLIACNQCNNEYIQIKFFLADDNCVTAIVDAELRPETCASDCDDLAQLLVVAVDKAYPEFVKAGCS